MVIGLLRPSGKRAHFGGVETQSKLKGRIGICLDRMLTARNLGGAKVDVWIGAGRYHAVKRWSRASLDSYRSRFTASSVWYEEIHAGPCSPVSWRRWFDL